MRNVLADILTQIGKKRQDEISEKSSIYTIIDLGKVYEDLGIKDDAGLFRDVKVIVPLKRAQETLTFEVDGKDLKNYSQLESGIAVPEYVAKMSKLPYKKFEPNDKMFLNLEETKSEL